MKVQALAPETRCVSAPRSAFRAECPACLTHQLRVSLAAWEAGWVGDVEGDHIEGARSIMYFVHLEGDQKPLTLFSLKQFSCRCVDGGDRASYMAVDQQLEA